MIGPGDPPTPGGLQDLRVVKFPDFFGPLHRFCSDEESAYYTLWRRKPTSNLLDSHHSDQLPNKVLQVVFDAESTTVMSLSHVRRFLFITVLSKPLISLNFSDII